MSITFHCEHCHQLIQAPDEAGGKRGKCPHCEGSNFVPAPPSETDELPLAPLDEEFEQQRKREIDRLMQTESVLLSETGGTEVAPRLSEKDKASISADELHHLVVNYCLDMAQGQLARADQQARRLSEFGRQGRQAVQDFATGAVLEPALDPLPAKVVQGYLKNLMSQLK